jgi:Antibiotic biosynthesis monooxygenase
MIVVTGSVTARQDSLAEVTRLSLEHVHRSRKEPGCISHAVHVDCENPLRLVFFRAMGRSRSATGPFRGAGVAPIRIRVAAARRGGRDAGALRRRPIREIVAHSWFAT